MLPEDGGCTVFKVLGEKGLGEIQLASDAYLVVLLALLLC